MNAFCRGEAAEIEQRLEGELWLRWGGQQIELEECREAVAAPAPVKPAFKPKSKPKPNRAWMEGFWVGGPCQTPPVAVRGS